MSTSLSGGSDAEKLEKGVLLVCQILLVFFKMSMVMSSRASGFRLSGERKFLVPNEQDSSRGQGQRNDLAICAQTGERLVKP